MTDRSVPLSVRTGLREPFGVTVGFPGYLSGIVVDLIEAAIYDLGDASVGSAELLADKIALKLRLNPSEYGRGVAGVRGQVRADAGACLDVMDLLVRASPDFGSHLEDLLADANHEYRVDFGNKCLVQRVSVNIRVLEGRWFVPLGTSPGACGGRGWHASGPPAPTPMRVGQPMP